jgi:hypothetical protein
MSPLYSSPLKHITWLREVQRLILLKIIVEWHGKQLPQATGMVQPAASVGQTLASSTAAVATTVLPVPVFQVTHCRLAGLNHKLASSREKRFVGRDVTLFHPSVVGSFGQKHIAS